MAAKLITAPVSFPVTLDEVKAHCRVDFDDDDAILEIYRKAATEDAERFTGRAFLDQTWDLYLDEFPADGDPIKIPRPPLIEVVGMFLRDADGAETEVEAATYLVDVVNEPARIALPSGGSWPTAATIQNAVRIRFRCGYVDEDTSPVTGEVPFPIKAAILLAVGDLYSNRENVIVGQSVAQLPRASEHLLRRYRVEVPFA